MGTIITLRNHKRNYFQTCRKKFDLLSKWETKEKPFALALGIAVHAGIEVWDLKKDDDKALEACLNEIETISLDEKEELQEQAARLLFGYFDKYRDDTSVTFISAETEFGSGSSSTKVLIAPGVEYEGRMDGMRSHNSRLLVKETKTTSLWPDAFFRKYEFDPQAIGYVFSAKQLYEQEVYGVLVDAIFKPIYKRPEPVYEQRVVRITPEMLSRWQEMMIHTAGQIREAQEKGLFYESWDACHAYYGLCEFWGFCTTGEMAVLEGTHKRIGEDSNAG